MAAGLGFKTFNTGEVLTSADVNGYLMQGVLVFASEAARNAAITSPQEGQFAYTKDNNSLWYYTGSAWAASGATGDIEGVTAGVGISGGGTSGTVTITNDMATTITAAGDIVVGTGSGTYDNLPIGTTGQVLTADTTVSPYKVKWATAGGGSALTLISTTTLSGSTTNVDNVFTSTYENYLILVSMDNNNTIGAMTMQLRAGGSATASGYYYGLRQIDWSGAVATAGNGSNVSSARIGTTFNGSPSPVTFTMFNPNRALRTTFQGLTLGADTGASGSQMYFGGFQDSTTQFDGFSVVGGSQTGKVRVYGYSN